MSDTGPRLPGPRQLRGQRVVATRLFVSSYACLWLIFAVLSTGAVARAGFTALAIGGVLDARRMVSASKHRNAKLMTFDAVVDKSGEAAGYLATYLVPFVSAAPSGPRTYVAYGIYFIVAWSIFVRTRIGLINPTLYLLRWQVVEARRGSDLVLVVCKTPPVAGERVYAASIAGSAGYVVKGDI